MSRTVSMEADLAGVVLRTPLVLAAGTAGVIDEMADVLDLSRVGAVTTKSITLQPRAGNDWWRILDLPGAAGMINAIGLANPGLDAFLEHACAGAAGGKGVAALPCRVIASVAGFSVDEYVKVAANIDEYSSAHGGCFPLLELNVSCPNVRSGVEFGHSAGLIRELLEAVRPVVRSAKIVVKLGPMTPDLPGVALAAALAGADALNLGNTMPAMSIDVEKRRPRLANTTGGLSGPAVHPVTLKHVYETRRKLAEIRPIPIIATGGVMHWQDAAAYVLAGASAVGVGTGLFVDPRCPLSITRGLEKWVARQGRTRLSELVGDLLPPETPGREEG
jgi:dihydroorotate dehydrogenase (NAD+) catalytic subunit